MLRTTAHLSNQKAVRACRNLQVPTHVAVITRSARDKDPLLPKLHEPLFNLLPVKTIRRR